MGNTFGFLLKYWEYIKNVENLSKIDDIYIYNESKNQYLVEGLIKTHPINISVKIIKNRFPNLKCEIQKDGEIFIDLQNDLKELKEYLPLFNNLGYFISKLTFDGKNWINNFDENSKPIGIILEPKFDIKIYPLPKILYHTSPTRFDKKIAKIGFIPKTGNKISNHPDRIYLTDNINIAKLFGKNLKKEYNNKYDMENGYSIYEINTAGLDINLYSDINLKNGGYYTDCGISPEYFRKIF